MTEVGPKAVLRTVEFLAAFAAISVAAHLTSSPVPVFLRYAMVLAFLGLVFGMLMPKPDRIA